MGIAEYYDSVAQYWDDDLPEEKFARHVAAMLSVPRGGCYVLDVGCGSGAMLLELADCGASDIQGIDVSGKMVELARKRCAFDPRISVDQKDFLSHIVTGYDVMIAFNSYHHFPNPEEFLYRAHSLLLNGGRLTVAFPYDRDGTNTRSGILPSGVTRQIFSAEKEVSLYWDKFFKVDCICDNEWIYLISGLSR